MALKLRNVRVVVLLDPQSCWSWVKSRDSLANQTSSVLSTSKWEDYSVQRRLEDLDLDRRSDVRTEILRVTGGWPFLLDSLFQRLPKTGDPVPEIVRFEQDMVSADSPLRTDFLAALGIMGVIAIPKVLEWLIRAGGVPEEYWTRDLVADGGLASDAECKAILEFLMWMGCVDLVGNPGDREIQIDKVVARMCLQRATHVAGTQG